MLKLLHAPLKVKLAALSLVVGIVLATLVVPETVLGILLILLVFWAIVTVLEYWNQP